MQKKPQPNAAVDLNEAESNAILRRLPPMPADENILQKNFAVRSKTNPPPRNGNVIPIKFPAGEQTDTPKISAADVPLSVVRYAPDGKNPLVSDLSVTFSQPMIAVSSQTEASENVPVILSPSVKGKWRWLGTTGLIFDAETRFPMATKYTATIPAGIKSAVGSSLSKDFSWTFETPPPKVEKFVPTSQNWQPAKPDEIMTVSFNQEIDEAAILPKINVTANGRRIPIRIITREIDESYTAIQYLGEIKPKQWIAFRSIEPLPLDSEIKVIFEKGLPSAEGSLTSDAAQEFSFKTYGALKFVKSFCNNYNAKQEECEPSNPFYLEFNNSLSPLTPDNSQVKIEPNLENAKIYASGRNIYIEGKKAARTTYKVTVSPTLKDQFDQLLGNEVSATFKVGSERPLFFAQGGNFVTLDPFLKPKFLVYSLNQPELKVKLYAVTPGDWEAFRQAMNTRGSEIQYRKPLPGKIVVDQTIAPGGAPDELIETRIDLSAALTNNFGQMIISVEPTAKPKTEDYYYTQQNQPVVKWLQATNIGLDAFVDNENVVAFATDLKTGKPLSDTQTFLFGGASAVSDAGGLVKLNLPQSTKYSGLLVAKSGEDTAILPENTEYWRTSEWYKKSNYGSYLWNVFDDRKMYRPNEEVSIKGYVREPTGGKFSDVAGLNDTNRDVFYKVKDSRNNEILKGQTKLNPFGAFDFRFKLPDNINLGYAHVTLGFGESADDSSHQFQIQEFRRPEFEVSIKAETFA